MIPSTNSTAVGVSTAPPRRRIPRFTGWLLAGALVAAAALLGTKTVSRPAPPAPPRWDVSVIDDPDVGMRYVPNSVGQSLYPDNPHGYFERSDPERPTWSVEQLLGSEAHLDYSLTSDSRSFRVTLPKLSGKDDWLVKLQQTGVHVKKGDAYRVTFRAKADAPRTIDCGVGPNHPPFDLLGLFEKLDLQTQPRDFSYRFVATATDDNARLYFNLAASDVPVEISNVVLRNESEPADHPVPIPATRYFVSYRFNSLGFRSADPIVPRPAGTFRIVALGNSATLGAGVQEQKTFEAQLQNHLNQGAATGSGATRYEVINTGVDGYATRRELRSYELFSSRYQPQLVLVMMGLDDDVALRDAVQRGLVLMSDGHNGEVAAAVDRFRRSNRARDYSDSIRALKELDAACRQRGAKLAVVVFANTPSNLWDKLAADVTAGLKGTGIPVLNLKDAMLRGGAQPNGLVVDANDSEPNEAAHRIAAEQIESFLRTEHLIP